MEEDDSGTARCIWLYSSVKAGLSFWEELRYNKDKWEREEIGNYYKKEGRDRMANKYKFAETFSHERLKEELERDEEFKLKVDEYEKLLKYDGKEFKDMFKRCLNEVLIQLFGLENLAFEISGGQYSPEDYYKVDARIAVKISKGFRNWFSMLNLQNIHESMLKEILFIILNNSRINKKDRREVEVDLEQGCYLLSKNGRREKWLCGVQLDSDEEEKKVPPMIPLNQYFSPVYQVKLSLEKCKNLSMEKLIKGQYTKNFEFASLINKVLAFDEGISYSEQYMTELQTGIFTAWKLYRIIDGLLLPESPNWIPKNKEFLKKVTVLAESVGSIHNLELRLYLLDVVDVCVQKLQKEISKDLYQGLEEIAKAIKKEAEEFNRRTEIIYKLFLYLYCEEERWKDLLGLLNMPTRQFSALLDEMQILSSRNLAKSYRKNQYDLLYWAGTKRDRHKVYSLIRKGLKKGQGWLELPK